MQCETDKDMEIERKEMDGKPAIFIYTNGQLL